MKEKIEKARAERQKLMEFSKPNTPVYLCNLEDVLEETTMGLLLPGAFDLNNI